MVAHTNRIRKMLPVRHHQDSVRRVVAYGKVTWGGQMHRVTEMLHDGGTVCTSGFAQPSFPLAGDTVSFSEGEKEMGAQNAGR